MIIMMVIVAMMKKDWIHLKTAVDKKMLIEESCRDAMLSLPENKNVYNLSYLIDWKFIHQVMSLEYMYNFLSLYLHQY